jgi:hypothetical protein
MKKQAQQDPGKARKIINQLARNVDKRAKVPKGFDLWSEKMQIMWLEQNQKRNVNVCKGVQ